MNLPTAIDNHKKGAPWMRGGFIVEAKLSPAVSFLGKAGLGQAVDLVRQRLGDEESRKEVPDAAYCQLWRDRTDPPDPFAGFLAPSWLGCGYR
jgi:hypothetical protein